MVDEELMEIEMFKIWFQQNDEAPVLAFTWTRGAQAGLNRAKQDAAAFGYNVAEITFFAQNIATGDIVAYA
jgi:hypothetical protein